MIATSSNLRQKRLQNILEHASGDKRFKILEAHMKKHQFKQDALIEVLHKAQELFGCLEDDLLLFVACLGTACYVKGADKVLAAIEQEAGVRAGETTPDNELSLLTARCIGACGIAPAVVYDGTVTPRQTAGSALEHLKGWIGHGS